MSGTVETEDRRSRLLRHLAQPGSFAQVSPLGCGRIALYRSMDGTSLGAGYVPVQEAEDAVAAGLACWNGTGKARRLRLVAVATPERSLSTRRMLVDGVAQPVLVDDRESPLLWLHRRAGKDGKPHLGRGIRRGRALSRRSDVGANAAAHDDELGCGLRSRGARAGPRSRQRLG